MAFRIILGLFIVSSVVCCISGQTQGANNADKCVIKGLEKKCEICSLKAHFNPLNWKNREGGCKTEAECCEQGIKPVEDEAKKAVEKCKADCRGTCELQGINENLYSATWPKKCVESCDVLGDAIKYGTHGARCPNPNECLNNLLPLNFDPPKIPEVVECRNDTKSCSECLIGKTLPDYHTRTTICLTQCNGKEKKLPEKKNGLSPKEQCQAHLYGQYIKMVEEACEDPEESDCTPDGQGLITGVCKSKGCVSELEKCIKESTPLAKDAANVVETKWKNSCMDSCTTAGEDVDECLAKVTARKEELQEDLISKMCEVFSSDTQY